MSDLKKLAQDFMAALSTDDAACYEAVLNEDVGMRLNRWDGRELYRPRARVMQRLMEEWASWPDPSLETFCIMVEDSHAAVEFRIQATEHNRYVEHNRSAFLSIKDGKIHDIDLYCPEPLPSTRRQGWIAPATLTDEELHHLFETMMYGNDPREWLMPNASSRLSLRGGMEGSGDKHPSSNSVMAMRLTDEDADRRIDEIIAYHRERNIGFQWWVTPYDSPADLRERLEQHGLALAGDAATMVRLGLDDLDVPTNSDVGVEILDGHNEAALEAVFHIIMVCFNMPQEGVDALRPGMIEHMRDEQFRKREVNYLARIKGQPAGVGRVQFRSGIAYMGGAATLPEFRGRKVYSTLLRRRMEDAHQQGYHLAAVNAEPLSRPILAHYGFKEYARMYLYGWMPVMDMDVIKSLVPQ